MVDVAFLTWACRLNFGRKYKIILRTKAANVYAKLTTHWWRQWTNGFNMRHTLSFSLRRLTRLFFSPDFMCHNLYMRTLCNGKCVTYAQICVVVVRLSLGDFSILKKMSACFAKPGKYSNTVAAIAFHAFLSQSRKHHRFFTLAHAIGLAKLRIEIVNELLIAS